MEIKYWDSADWTIFIICCVGGLFFTLIATFFLLPAVFSHALFYQTTFNGEHTGQVTAVEDYGVIWVTTRAYFKSDAQSSQEDDYCVISDKVRDRLIQASETKETITIIYDDYFLIGYGNCGTEGDIIVGVK